MTTKPARTAKETLREAIFNCWNSKLREMGFRGGKSSRMHRVLEDIDAFQVLELQWSRYNAEDDARVRVHVGRGRLSQLPRGEKPHLDHCEVTYAPMQSRDADDNWIRFREGDDEAGLLRTLRKDFREAWQPFFELTAAPTFDRRLLETQTMRELLDAMPRLRLVHG